MIFSGRNELKRSGPQGISATWGYVRNGGKTWHGGVDVNGLDDALVRMPGYKDKCISGKVVQARIVTSRFNPTWEWGYYICIKLDANQTPDAVNYLYFCHNKSLCVKAGDTVKTGDVLAVMGKTGNAATTYAHCHFEVRAAAIGRGLDPCAYTGFPNAPGVYGGREDVKPKLFNLTLKRMSAGDRVSFEALAKQLGIACVAEGV